MDDRSDTYQGSRASLGKCSGESDLVPPPAVHHDCTSKREACNSVLQTREGLTKTFSNAACFHNKIVSWNGDFDPQNPKNFSPTRKWLIVSTTCAMTFCITFASSIYTSTVTAAGEQFGVSSETMLLGVALYVLGFAAGEQRCHITLIVANHGQDHSFGAQYPKRTAVKDHC